jgi:hypothetical protein
VFTLKPSVTKPTTIEKAIDDLVSKMSEHEGDSKEYTDMAKNLKVLCEANAAVKAANKPNAVSADTIAVIAGNLIGITMILGFERVNVVTSKALGFVMKPKIST